ncbi:MAG TPA: SDR family NAD(P)-dependent oxidoreductase, partial [Caulobacteraceae bacterium]
VDPADREALKAAVAQASALLVTAPPDADGCPGLRTVGDLLKTPTDGWLGYVSSTSVYGDRGGGWVLEDGELNAPTIEGARRTAAEAAWRALGAHVFRLPAIYGPGRSILDRLRDGSARLVSKPGQVFNRIHVEDVASGLMASLARPRPGAVYNLTDDAPAAADTVTAWAAERLGLPQPPRTGLDDPAVSDAMRRFYRDSKRVSNALAKAELGWRPAYPSWREGLEAILAAEG